MKLVSLLIFLTLFVPAPSQAQAFDLYSASVAVEDQGQSAREAAFPAALTQVLGKLSGLQHFDDYPEVAPAVRNARSLVVSFHYNEVEQEAESSPEAGAGEESSSTVTYLVVQFSQGGVDDLMRALALPRWPPGREPLDIWVLIDDGPGRQVLPLEYAYLRPQIERVADTRGLPLSWPTADAEGEYGVDVQLLWGGYTETVAPNGGSANVLVVAARREGPEWNVRLILDHDGNHQTWRSRDTNLERVLTAAMHQSVDHIAAAKAFAPSDQGSRVHRITVAGMTSGDAYAQCLSYLESLSIVDRVEVEGADSGGVRLVLSLNAAAAYFEQILAQDRVLEYAEASGHYVLQQ